MLRSTNILSRLAFSRAALIVNCMSAWKRNVAAVWLSQFISIAGFAFGLSFSPYYFQELGVSDPYELKTLVMLFGASAPVTLAIFSPFWGLIADRFGRRLMLLRANLAAVVILALMAIVEHPWQLVALRFCQGAFTGTMTAAQALIASHTPRARTGMALSMLSSAVYSGAMAGAFLGGICADTFGYRTAFMVSSGLMTVATFLVLFATSETLANTELEESAEGCPPVNRGQRIPLRILLPVLVLLMAASVARRFDISFLPLLVQEIHGSIDGAATLSGSLSAVSCVAGLLAGLMMGILSDRFAPERLALAVSSLAMACLIPHMMVQSMLSLFVVRFLFMFAASGLEPLFQVMLAKHSTKEQQGAIFGWAGTARAIGWMLGPLGCWIIASAYGLRAIYIMGMVIFALLIILTIYVARRLSPEAN